MTDLDSKLLECVKRSIKNQEQIRVQMRLLIVEMNFRLMFEEDEGPFIGKTIDSYTDQEIISFLKRKHGNHFIDCIRNCLYE
jgi:hypothetical protein